MAITIYKFYRQKFLVWHLVFILIVKTKKNYSNVWKRHRHNFFDWSNSVQINLVAWLSSQIVVAGTSQIYSLLYKCEHVFPWIVKKKDNGLWLLNKFSLKPYTLKYVFSFICITLIIVGSWILSSHALSYSFLHGQISSFTFVRSEEWAFGSQYHRSVLLEKENISRKIKVE